MIALPLQTVIFVFLLAIASAGLAAVAIDRRRFRDPLLVRAGAQPTLLGQRFDSAPFGLLLLDPQLRGLYANANARRLLSLDSSLKRSDGGHWRVELQQDLTAIQSSNHNQPLYRILTLPTGQTISWWICPLPRLTLLFVTDLSQQRRLQQASQAFLSTLSHELRTPLTAVLAHLDIVQKREVDEATRQNSLTIIHQELNRLTRLVQDMLQLGRLEMSEVVEKRPLDIFLIAEAAVAEVILMAEAKNITISLEAIAALPRVPGDADKLKQVFLNVLDNSIQYGRPGDQIKIYLKPETDDVLVIIQDTGPGIPPHQLPHVTERLYRAHKENQGSGLGLAIVTEILRLHDTRLEIESPGDEKTGVKVSFLLPANESQYGD
jgi:signal transduction histidine kinase